LAGIGNERNTEHADDQNDGGKQGAALKADFLPFAFFGKSGDFFR
jgi:hypothetical protein